MLVRFREADRNEFRFHCISDIDLSQAENLRFTCGLLDFSSRHFLFFLLKGP